jgi:hypothetical protein
MKAQPQIENASTIISSLILRPKWYTAKRVHQSNPNIIDITDGTSYITFKNEMMDKIFHTPLSQSVSGYENLKPKRKTEIMNHYFDNTLASQHNTLIQSATEQLLLLKSQQTDLEQQEANNIYYLIYNSLKTEPVQIQQQPQNQNDDEFLQNESVNFILYRKTLFLHEKGIRI